jgi:hypothetical protein
VSCKSGSGANNLKEALRLTGNLNAAIVHGSASVRGALRAARAAAAGGIVTVTGSLGTVTEQRTLAVPALMSISESVTRPGPGLSDSHGSSLVSVRRSHVLLSPACGPATSVIERRNFRAAGDLHERLAGPGGGSAAAAAADQRRGCSQWPQVASLSRPRSECRPGYAGGPGPAASLSEKRLALRKTVALAQRHHICPQCSRNDSNKSDRADVRPKL